MINTAYPTLYKAPEALDVIGMGITDNVLASTVIAPFVRESVGIDRVIDRILVSVNSGFLGNIGVNKRHNRGAFGISNNVSVDFALPLSDTDHGCFAFCTTTTLAMPFAADVSFIDFNFLRKYAFALIKKFADFLKHSPGCLISYASPALKLFGRMTATSGCHPEHSFEPSLKRSAGFAKYCVSKWGYLMSAVVAFIDRAGLKLVMLGNFLTNWTLNTVGPLFVFKPFKASIVVGEHCVKFLGCVFNLFNIHRSYPHLPIIYHNGYTMSRDSYLMKIDERAR